MKRTVNQDLIDTWMRETGKGEADLSVESGISVHTIHKVRNRVTPLVPAKPQTLGKIAVAIGVHVDDLFPLIEDSEAS